MQSDWQLVEQQAAQTGSAAARLAQAAVHVALQHDGLLAHTRAAQDALLQPGPAWMEQQLQVAEPGGSHDSAGAVTAPSPHVGPQLFALKVPMRVRLPPAAWVPMYSPVSQKVQSSDGSTVNEK